MLYFVLSTFVQFLSLLLLYERTIYWAHTSVFVLISNVAVQRMLKLYSHSDTAIVAFNVFVSLTRFWDLTRAKQIKIWFSQKRVLPTKCFASLNMLSISIQCDCMLIYQLFQTYSRVPNDAVVLKILLKTRFMVAKTFLSLQSNVHSETLSQMHQIFCRSRQNK